MSARTIGQFIEALPQRERLTTAERTSLVFLLAMNQMSDEDGICILAHDTRSATRLLNLLEKGGHFR